MADGSEGTRGLKRSSEQVGNLKHGEGDGLIKRGAVRDFSSPYFEPYYAGVFTLGKFAELLTMIFCLSYFNKKVFLKVPSLLSNSAREKILQVKLSFLV